MLEHPYTVPGLGDAGAHCTLICDASMPTFMLSYWGRDATGDDRFPIEWVVKRQCADTADLVGLHDRGRSGARSSGRPQRRRLSTRSTSGSPHMLADLPAGGRRLVQKATGLRRDDQRG